MIVNHAEHRSSLCVLCVCVYVHVCVCVCACVCDVRNIGQVCKVVM